MAVTTEDFEGWLKNASHMKLNSKASVLRLTKEGITNFESLTDFDKKSLEGLPAICKGSIKAIAADAANGIVAERLVPGASLSAISVRRLIVAMNAAQYYTSINRLMTVGNMGYDTVLKGFKIEWDTYQDLRDQDAPDVPLISDKDNDRRVIKWVPVLHDCLARSYGINGPLSYILREDSAVPTEAIDPLELDSYYGSSGSLHDELTARLPHSGPIYKNDNCSVFLKIEKASRGTSVESTVKAFSRRKDGRGAYLALIANHAGDTKYRAIHKKRMNLLQGIKWNGRSYPLESHVSNHRQAVDDLTECSNHITVAVPDPSQRVEYLIDSIACSDTALQAAIGLVRANTNNMRNDFEAAASTLIEVDPYRKSQRSGGGGRNATIAAIDFGAGRGSTGVDLRWHPKPEFKKLSDEQRDELVKWMRTSEGKKVLQKSKGTKFDNKRKSGGGGNGDRTQKSSEGGNWKKKFKKALNTPKGLAHIMSVMADEEKNNQALVFAFQSTQTSLPPAPAPVQPAQPQIRIAAANAGSIQSSMPATAMKLASILKRK